MSFRVCQIDWESTGILFLVDPGPFTFGLYFLKGGLRTSKFLHEIVRQIWITIEIEDTLMEAI